MSPRLLPFTTYPTSILGHCLSPLMSQSLSCLWIFPVQYCLLSIRNHKCAYMTLFSLLEFEGETAINQSMSQQAWAQTQNPQPGVVSHSKLKLTWRDPIFYVVLSRFWPLSQLSRTSSLSRPRSHAISAVAPSSSSCLNWSLSPGDCSLSLP